MSKPNGVSAVILGVLAVIAAISFFSFKYAYSAETKVAAVKDRVIVTEVKVEGFRIDLRRIETAQKEMRTVVVDKLDRLLERSQ